MPKKKFCILGVEIDYEFCAKKSKNQKQNYRAKKMEDFPK